MTRSWTPSTLGRLLTSSPAWTFTLDGERFSLSIGGQTRTGQVSELASVTLDSGAIWSRLQLTDQTGQAVTLDGIANGDARLLQTALQRALLLADFPTRVAAVQDWVNQARHACQSQLQHGGWLTRDFKATLAASKPTTLEEVLRLPDAEALVARLPDETRAAVRNWQRPFEDVADELNQAHLSRERTAARPFFDQVEKSPLTDEQVEAVLCLDNRVLLVAAAGSGKTSTMVAKAGHVLQRGYVAPDRMLLLAFNNDAASELRERLKSRLLPLGLPADRVAAQTFHAFGLEVIDLASGKKPSLAPWVESGRDLEELLTIVDELKDKDPAFRSTWDLFRIVFSFDLPRFSEEEKEPEAWDRQQKREGFETLNGEVIKSRGEQNH